MILTTHRDSAAIVSSATGFRSCHRFSPCPAATAPERHAARTIAAHPEQGWSLPCNGVVLFDDNGELLPDGCAVTHLPCMIPNGRAAGSGRHRTRRPECDAAA
jgi:hypothetical protein